LRFRRFWSGSPGRADEGPKITTVEQPRNRIV
jgi:hypothetical protein